MKAGVESPFALASKRLRRPGDRDFDADALISSRNSFLGDALLNDMLLEGGVFPGVVGRRGWGVACFDGVRGLFLLGVTCRDGDR